MSWSKQHDCGCGHKRDDWSDRHDDWSGKHDDWSGKHDDCWKKRHHCGCGCKDHSWSVSIQCKCGHCFEVKRTHCSPCSHLFKKSW
ncbi:MAG TPA: hypothetical protein VD973_26935 [Symbiobacteriaceae bacterium]|jgi:hypothetical protein|nr:hypothetical protein [Symbiobacteriaceae bacterium]